MTRKRWSAKALAERRRRAMHLHLAGFTQEEIADQLGVERSMISRDLQSARDARPSGDSPDLEEARFTQLAKLDQLEHAYWIAWEESKREKETRTAQRSEAEGHETVGLRRERQAGNPAYLIGIFRCIAKRETMLGLDQKSAASGPPPKRMPSKQEVEQTLRMMSATVGGPSCLLPGDPYYSPNPWSLSKDGTWVDSAGMKFDPEPWQFDPTHPPLAGTFSPEEVAESWKDKKIYDHAVDGYGLRLTL